MQHIHTVFKGQTPAVDPCRNSPNGCLHWNRAPNGRLPNVCLWLYSARKYITKPILCIVGWQVIG